MKSIDGRLNALEKQAKGKRQQGKYCTDHPREPVIIFNKNTPPDIPAICAYCGKRYPQHRKPVILDFTYLGIDDNWG